MYQINSGGCCVRDHMVGGFTTSLPMQSVPITTDVWGFDFLSGRGVQHYVIKFVSDLWQVDGFLRVLQFAPPIKLTATIWLKYCWKWH
jgi:hypothetical protein